MPSHRRLSEFYKNDNNFGQFFEKPLKRFTPTTSLGVLFHCHAPEGRATAVALQRAIAQAIARWELARDNDVAEPTPQPIVAPHPSVITPTRIVVPRENDFREIDHQNDSYWEEREDFCW